jgi:FMN phosphatase YigB (HAD superfamily)
MHLFDGIMISGDEKLVKPDVFFYKKCLEKFNLQADE